MTAPRRIVLLVEGDGDAAAAPLLLKRLLGDLNALHIVVPDEHAIKIGDYPGVAKNDFVVLRDKLRVAAKRKHMAGCLVLLDGDCDFCRGRQRFCARHAAIDLATAARNAGGGTLFSVAAVFACQEFESWLIAGIESLVDQPLSDGRVLIYKYDPRRVAFPPDLEVAPRDAKRWLSQLAKTGYKPTRDQDELTRIVNLDAIRARGLRGFRRFEAAVTQLAAAIQSGQPCLTPQ
jgi:hypothetical protein